MPTDRSIAIPGRGQCESRAPISWHLQVSKTHSVDCRLVAAFSCCGALAARTGLQSGLMNANDSKRKGIRARCMPRPVRVLVTASLITRTRVLIEQSDETERIPSLRMKVLSEVVRDSVCRAADHAFLFVSEGLTHLEAAPSPMT